MKILVTGVSGFLGGHLINTLAKRAGCDLVGISRSRVISPICGAQLISGVEVGSGTDWFEYLRDVDVVVHCAAWAHFPKAVTEMDIRDMQDVNVGGTARLAQQAANAGVKRFIFISSIGVLGDRTNEPFDGTEDPRPQTVYAESKLKAEKELMSICEETGLEFVIIRPPMIYGPEAPGNFLRLIRFSSLPLPLGRANGARSFVSMWNLVDLVSKCLEHPGASNQVLLVSDGQDVTTREFLRAIAQAKGTKSYLPAVPAGFMHFILSALGKESMWQSLFGSLQIDITKTRTLLGWEPPLSFGESMQRCFQPKHEVDQ